VNSTISHLFDQQEHGDDFFRFKAKVRLKNGVILVNEEVREYAQVPLLWVRAHLSFGALQLFCNVLCAPCEREPVHDVHP